MEAKEVKSRYFKESEFQRCSPACSLQDMDASFMLKLDTLRVMCGYPLILNSAFRSSEWEKKKGRSGLGDHSQGKGVDVRAITAHEKYKIVKAALEIGFNRVGIAKAYVHIGMGDALPSCVIWTY